MNKKRRLVVEIKKTSKRIYVLVFLSFVFCLIFFYSYNQVNYKDGSSYGLSSQKGVDIFVKIIGNHAPIISINTSEIYVCENSLLNYPFRVIDLDGDVCDGTISPMNPFYVTYYSVIDPVTNQYLIYSGILGKDDAGGVNNGFKRYPETIFMDDHHNNIDSKNVNITVIEVNNPPVIQPIGVKTVWTHGENSTFNYQVMANDLEDGDSNSGKLGFNISFSGIKLFNISKNGTMYFIPDSDQIGNYHIQVCVNDTGIKKPHPNISLCNQDGGSLYSCDNFSLTITDQNRPPKIITHFPENLSIDYTDGENVYFNISSHDPDGTIVDNYWYVDDVLNKFDKENNKSNFLFNYICGFNGKSKIKVVITDGLLNDSLEWNLSVSRAACVSPGGSSGGGGGGVACIEKWVCNDWSICQNLKDNFNLNKINFKVNTLINNRCSLFKWDDSVCGYQTRNCTDLKKCRSNITMPGIMQECYYTKNPSCNDSIKNCHNGSCELLTDCGGPCKSCPTCSDGIKNQNEEEIDCGGVCPVCKKETPQTPAIDYFKIIMFFSIIFLILAIIGIGILGFRYIILQKKLGEITNRSISLQSSNDILKQS